MPPLVRDDGMKAAASKEAADPADHQFTYTFRHGGGDNQAVSKMTMIRSR
jgi:hypothetical protein